MEEQAVVQQKLAAMKYIKSFLRTDQSAVYKVP